MQKFVRNLLTEWRRLRLPFDKETVLAAVSGGADSVGLVLALHELYTAQKLKLNFVVGHFNHDLREAESLKDAEFVEELAGKLSLKFIGGIPQKKDKLQNKAGNLEQLARLARYEFLENAAISVNASIVLTGHTQTDQAETFLLRLLRGSGGDGLGAMKIVSQIPGAVVSGQWSVVSGQDIRAAGLEQKSKIQNPKSEIKLVRPLLSWAKRQDTEDFCRQKKVEFCLDAMNDDLDFLRVRVRKELMPLLNTFNPKIVEKLSNTAFLLQADADELNREAEKLLERARCEIIKGIKYKYLAESSPSLRRRALRLWILENNSNLRQIASSHIEAVENIMFSRKSGRNIELPNGKIIVKSGGKLFFEKSKVEKS